MSTLRSKSAWLPWHRRASRLSLSSALKNRCLLDSYSISPSSQLPARRLQNQTFQNVLCKVHELFLILFFFPIYLFFPLPSSASCPVPVCIRLDWRVKCLVSWNESTMGERWGGRRGVRVCVLCGRWRSERFLNTVRKKKKRIIMCPINATADHALTPPLQQGVGWGRGWEVRRPPLDSSASSSFSFVK